METFDKLCNIGRVVCLSTTGCTTWSASLSRGEMRTFLFKISETTSSVIRQGNVQDEVASLGTMPFSCIWELKSLLNCSDSDSIVTIATSN